MEQMNTKALDAAYVAPTYARFDLEIIGGEGSILYGSDGKEYIDMGSGIAVNTFGCCDSDWQAAVIEQLGNFQHTSNLYYTAPCAELAALLCRKTGLSKVFFSNSGAEANECAIKAARAYAEKRKGKGAHTIITLENSFHGRTITTLAATAQEHFHKDFTPLTDGFAYAGANDIESVRSILETTECAAIMMELVQGEGGVNPLEQSFVDEVVALARSKDVLLIVDEVQTGNGRTGTLYAFMQYGFVPDILTTAKGLGGGLPIGATLLGERVKDVYSPGMHGSTFGGNPICCAGAMSIVSRLDDEFLNGVTKKSEYIFHSLEGAPGVKDVRGLGLMIGILPANRTASEIIGACMERGVLLLSAKNKVRLLPPLNIPNELLEKAISILKEELAK